MKSILTLCALLLLCSCAGTPSSLSKDRIAAILASPERSAADRTNDRRRKPEEMLAFLDLRPGMKVLDVSAGGGYTTELLARAVGPEGRVYAQSAPGSTSPERIAVRMKNAGIQHIVPVQRRFDDPVPPDVQSNALDLVTFMFNYHDMGHMGVDRAALNRAVFAALKPGGMYVIADHAGRPGTGISESNTLHRVEDAFVRREVEAAGFRLAEEGSFLRNPQDPRDQNEPPYPKDEFVFKFVKP